MTATTPQETHSLWADAFNRGDVDALLELYEDDCVFLAQPGQPAAGGKHAIREVLTAFVSAGATFTIERTEVIDRPDLAILYSKWTLTGGTGPDGNPLDLTGETTDVVRRQSDGRWLYAIDNPWGVQAFAPVGAAAS